MALTKTIKITTEDITHIEYGSTVNYVVIGTLDNTISKPSTIGIDGNVVVTTNDSTPITLVEIADNIFDNISNIDSFFVNENLEVCVVVDKTTISTLALAQAKYTGYEIQYKLDKLQKGSGYIVNVMQGQENIYPTLVIPNETGLAAIIQNYIQPLDVNKLSELPSIVIQPVYAK